MPCYNPTRVIISKDREIKWKSDYRFLTSTTTDRQINLPCRDCIGCHKSRSREWSVRAFHEALLHTRKWRDPETKIQTAIPDSSVITLTLNEEHCPANMALDHKKFQRFMKRLRKGAEKPIRYIMCGEYGGKTQRPHFHAVLFGHTFNHQYDTQDRNGQRQTMSEELDLLWSERLTKASPITNIGRATVEGFTFAGAMYVAGYVAKKSNTTGHLGPIITTIGTGGTVKYTPLSPEYQRMSCGNKYTRGLGARWLLKPENLDRTYSDDSLQIGEWTFPIPKYYDRLLAEVDPIRWEAVQAKRLESMTDYAAEWTHKRCSDAEEIVLSDLQLRRDSL